MTATYPPALLGIFNEAVMPPAEVLQGRSDAHIQASPGYLEGARLLTVTFLNATVLFLVQIEIFIVTTSLVAITEELGDFDRASWVLASYLLGYVSFVVIAAKLSDIYGRKPVYVLALLMFTVLSGGCAAAQSMTQLLDAGVRLISFGLGLSAGTIASAVLAKRAKVPAIYYVMLGASLQILGYALLATIGTYVDIPPTVYVYQIIVGLGCRITYQSLVLNIPLVAEKRDHAVAMGAANQFRAIGSTIVVAVTTAIFNGYVTPRLSALGIPDPNRVVEGHGRIMTGIPPEIWDKARDVLSPGYNLQMFVLVGCGGAQAAVALLLWNGGRSETTTVSDAGHLGASPERVLRADCNGAITVPTKTSEGVASDKNTAGSNSA